MPVIRHADSRRTTTPNGVMTTHASPTQGGSTLAVWRVEMVAGAAGPQHSFDTEQVWTAQDCGPALNPDGMRAQAEGCLMQTIHVLGGRQDESVVVPSVPYAPRWRGPWAGPR